MMRLVRPHTKRPHASTYTTATSAESFLQSEFPANNRHFLSSHSPLSASSSPSPSSSEVKYVKRKVPFHLSLDASPAAEEVTTTTSSSPNTSAPPPPPQTFLMLNPPPMVDYAEHVGGTVEDQRAYVARTMKQKGVVGGLHLTGFTLTGRPFHYAPSASSTASASASASSSSTSATAAAAKNGATSATTTATPTKDEDNLAFLERVAQCLSRPEASPFVIDVNIQLLDGDKRAVTTTTVMPQQQQKQQVKTSTTIAQLLYPSDLLKKSSDTSGTSSIYAPVDYAGVNIPLPAGCGAMVTATLRSRGGGSSSSSSASDFLREAQQRGIAVGVICWGYVVEYTTAGSSINNTNSTNTTSSSSSSFSPAPPSAATVTLLRRVELCSTVTAPTIAVPSDAAVTSRMAHGKRLR